MQVKHYSQKVAKIEKNCLHTDSDMPSSSLFLIVKKKKNMEEILVQNFHFFKHKQIEMI